MQKIKMFARKWYKKKRVYAILIIVLVILFFILKPEVDNTVVIDTVKLQDLESTVLATGEVTSNTDLSLSFNSTGVVKTVRVKVGDKVSSGSILATLEGGSLFGAVTSAQGALKGAQAKYQKLIDGTSSEEITLAEVALSNAQKDLENTQHQQTILVENAYRTLLSDRLQAVPGNDSLAGSTAPIISGSYTGSKEGYYLISTYNAGPTGYFSVSGLGTSSGNINSSTRFPLGNEGLFIEFPSNFSGNSGNNWIVNIPNKQSSTYVANLNAYNSALQAKINATTSAQSLVDSRNAELAVKRSKARTFELDLAQADVLSAQGQLQSAQASYENAIIRAPASGTVTKVNIKLGELAQAQNEAIVLEDVDNLYIEADINEANIIKIKPGQKATFSIDAFGPNVSFSGEVIHVDPGATTVEGIVNYKIKVSIADVDKSIRPGMNADVKILIDKRANILVVPALALSKHDGKAYLRVITDEKHKKYVEKEVETGMMGDGNLVEITSGVSALEKIAVISKSNQ